MGNAIYTKGHLIISNGQLESYLGLLQRIGTPKEIRVISDIMYSLTRYGDLEIHGIEDKRLYSKLIVPDKKTLESIDKALSEETMFNMPYKC